MALGRLLDPLEGFLGLALAVGAWLAELLPALAGQPRAGEGDRTLDIDLGKVALYH